MPPMPRKAPISTSWPPSSSAWRRSSPPATPHTLEQQLEIAADALRLPPWDAIIGKLSGGEKRRVALCRLLLQQARHAAARRTDQPSRRRIGRVAGAVPGPLPGTVVAVTHDRYFLDNAAEWILELDRGRGIPWKGNYTDWLEQKDERLKQEESGEKARQKAIAEGTGMGRARTPRAAAARARRAWPRFEELKSVDYQRRNETNEIFIPPGERLGDKVIEFKNVTKRFGDRLLIDDLSFTDPAGRHRRHHRPERRRQVDPVQDDHRPGKAGQGRGQHRPHGQDGLRRPEPRQAGGQQERLAGSLRRLRHPQHRQASRSSRAPTSAASTSRAQDQQKLVGTLSGGERGRLHLAKTLLQGGNVLLLDEPSNDLDIETLRALEDALLEFPGCAMVISHDRWFLDRIATHILAFEGDSHVEFFQGNYREYEEDKTRRLGEEGAQAASPALQGAEVRQDSQPPAHAGVRAAHWRSRGDARMTSWTALRQRWQQANTLVCVGLDPEPAKFPGAPALTIPMRVFEFCRAIVDATADLVCCFKPQIAHFAALRRRGRAAAADRAHPRRAPGHSGDPRRQARRHRQHRRSTTPSKPSTAIGADAVTRQSLSGPRFRRSRSWIAPTRASSCCAAPPTRARATCRT